MMNMKAFARKIKQLNGNNRWILLLVAYFITIMLSSVEELGDPAVISKDNIVGMLIDCTMSVMAGILCCISFYDMYLRTYTTLETKEYFDDSIAKYVRFHGFPVDEYFSYIMKRFMPVQVVMLVWAIIGTVSQRNMAKVVVGVIVFVVPFLVWKIRKNMFNYAITHFKAGWKIAIKIYGNLLQYVVSLILVMYTFFFGVFLGYLVIESLFMPMNDDEVVICFRHGIYIVLIMWLMLWPLVLFINEKVVKKYHIKGIVALLTMLVIAVTICSNVANHIIIEENEIFVAKNFKNSEYSINDIDKFEVYEDTNEAALAMRLYCNDGEEISYVFINYSNSDKWGQLYDNEYEFVREFAKKLLDKGAKGSVVEPEKMVKDLKEYWGNDIYDKEEKALEEIVELLK